MKKYILILCVALMIPLLCCCSTSSLSEEISEVSVVKDDYLSSSFADVYKIAADPKHGCNIDSYLVIPKDYSYSRLLVYPYKYGQRASIEKQEVELRRMIKDNHRTSLPELNAITLWPVLPQEDSELMRLGLMLNVTGKWKRLDLQVVKAIENANSFLQGIGILLEPGIALTGYSGEGSFCVNFAMLHPDMVHAVAAGGLAWHIVQPLESLFNYSLEWPLGIKGFKKITGYDFDYESWKTIHYYLDQGLLDDRGVKYGSKLGEAGFDISKEEEMWGIFANSLIKCSDNIELVLYKTLGHSSFLADYVEFLKANEGDAFVPIKPSLPADTWISNR